MSIPSILIDLIWGNDDETQVFAHAHDTANNSPSLLTFRLTQDTTTQQPQSLANRIVSRFHDLPVSSSSATFPDRASMRKALGAAIQRAWPSCAHAAAAPDAVVDLFDDDDDDERDEQGGAEGVNIQWLVRYESTLYQEFLDALLPVDDFFFRDNMHSSSREAIKLIDIKDIVLIHPLPGRGTSALVHIPSNPNALYAMKSIAFTDLLNSREEFTYNRDSFYHSIKLISHTIPPHPNIQPPPRILITSTTHHNKVLLLRGTLYPYMNQGTLDTQITTAQEAHNQPRISLQSKARWCLQMCQALLHTHRTAKTFHMDIKPANFLVNDHGNLVLIDWEQSGAPWYTLAPEANGEWDVARVSDDDDDDDGNDDDDASQLVYSRYQGPERVNLPRGRPAWNVFPEWSEKWPMAAEAAEVFSLGRTMWMLLQQVPQEDIELLSPDELHVCWSEVAADIPDAWKAVVMQCMEKDPLARIKLTDLVSFWEEHQNIVY